MTMVSRRTLLKGFGGAVGAAALPAALVGCGGDDDPAPIRRRRAAAAKEVGTVTIGSNASDPVPKASYEKVFAAFKTESGGDVRSTRSTTTPSRSRSTPISRAARTTSSCGSPATACSSSPSAGWRTDISDVWGKIGGNFSEALKNASTGLDGKQYFVPFYYYPWALFYRKSVFEEKGYEVPDDARRAQGAGRRR